MRATRRSWSRLMRGALHNARGLTMMEMMMATTITTALGGVLIILATGANQIYSNKILGGTLEGELDATIEQIKRDIWEAVDARDADPETSVGTCPGSLTLGTTKWLCLDKDPPNFASGGYGDGDVRYLLQGTGVMAIGGGSPPPKIKLVRQEYQSGTWTNSRTLVNDAVQAESLASVATATINNLPAPQLVQRQVRLSLANQRTDNFGRQYQRSVESATYRLQTPTP